MPQSLAAAAATVPDSHAVHSLHGYFILAGVRVRGCKGGGERARVDRPLGRFLMFFLPNPTAIDVEGNVHTHTYTHTYTYTHTHTHIHIHPYLLN